jgi:NADH:ubiquinone oxidoreductase subunit E
VSILPTDRNALRRELRERFPRDHGQLLPALHYLHYEFGHLPDWAMEVVGWHLGIPSSEVYGAATSYTELRLEEAGTSVVRVCTALSCATAGASQILDALGAEFDVSPGSTSEDRRLTLEQVPCGFLCAMAPAMEVDGEWHGRVDRESALQIVRRAVSA